jgi:hypothetical protein
VDEFALCQSEAGQVTLLVPFSECACARGRERVSGLLYVAALNLSALDNGGISRSLFDISRSLFDISRSLLTGVTCVGQRNRRFAVAASLFVFT